MWPSVLFGWWDWTHDLFFILKQMRTPGPSVENVAGSPGTMPVPVEVQILPAPAARMALPWWFRLCPLHRRVKWEGAALSLSSQHRMSSEAAHVSWCHTSSCAGAFAALGRAPGRDRAVQSPWQPPAHPQPAHKAGAVKSSFLCWGEMPRGAGVLTASRRHRGGVSGTCYYY